MFYRLIAIATSFLLMIISPSLPTLAATSSSTIDSQSSEINLPSALDDSIFDDLPFEQRRQALRDEVERGPKKSPSTNSPQKYNLLIR